jgi:hypothetical protein
MKPIFHQSFSCWAKRFAALLIVAQPSVSNAAPRCTEPEQLLFSCVVQKSGKHIELCDTGATIRYQFGKPKAVPDIVLSVPRKQATTSQWKGIGRYISYAVDIPNGNTVYSVFFSVDRLTDSHAIEAGVNVRVDEKLLATVKCVENSIVNNLEGVNLAETAD